MALLPFLKKKDSSLGGVMTIERKPDGDSPSQDPAMESAARDLSEALESKDYKKIAAALRAAFEIADGEPHDEGPHIGEEGLE